jgi:UPF0755 protein
MHPFLNLSQIYALLNIIGNFFFFYILGIMKKILFTIVLFALFAGLTGTFWVYHSIRKPSVNEKFVIVKIPQGASATKIGQILQKNGLISSEHLFTLWCRYQQPTLKAGWYEIPPQLSIEQLVEFLEEGKNAVHKVTIPEGRASWEIPDYLQKAFPGLDTAEWNRLVHDTAFTHDLGVEADNLEGYLLPETYPFPYEAKEKDIIAQMVKANLRLKTEFEEKESPVWKTLGGWHQVLTLASLVEEETGKVDERPLIAGVFLNRLRLGISLGSDPSVRFIFKNLTGPIYKSQLNCNSSYNTRKYKGLMPGPISNPGRKAIEAVLYPEGTNHLYFVAKDDGSGTHYFSSSLKEHNKYRDIAAHNRGEK